MANHGKTGDELGEYRRRKKRAHIVSGLYRAEGSTKVIRLSENQFRRKLRLKGDGKTKGKVIHFEHYRCKGK
jgi:hypothetical protein